MLLLQQVTLMEAVGRKDPVLFEKQSPGIPVTPISGHRWGTAFMERYKYLHCHFYTPGQIATEGGEEKHSERFIRYKS